MAIDDVSGGGCGLRLFILGDIGTVVEDAVVEDAVVEEEVLLLSLSGISSLVCAYASVSTTTIYIRFTLFWGNYFILWVTIFLCHG